METLEIVIVSLTVVLVLYQAYKLNKQSHTISSLRKEKEENKRKLNDGNNIVYDMSMSHRYEIMKIEHDLRKTTRELEKLVCNLKIENSVVHKDLNIANNLIDIMVSQGYELLEHATSVVTTQLVTDKQESIWATFSDDINKDVEYVYDREDKMLYKVVERRLVTMTDFDDMLEVKLEAIK